MRRKGIALLLLLAALTLLPACRRRLDPDGQDRIRETVSQPEPGPVQGTGQQIRDPDLEPDPEQIQQKRDPQGSVVDETVPARGGETVPRGPEAPEPGNALTVTLDPMGGDCDVTTLRVRTGEVYGVLPVPSREGWTFRGWFREPEGGETFLYTEHEMYESDLRLYELEEKLRYTDLMRVSKSVILNTGLLRSVRPLLNGRFEATLQNGERVLISRHYLAAFRERFGV